MTLAARHNASTLAPGYKLDRYELLCPIAEGGMASVWVARQRGKHGFEKLVAIKTILPKFASDVRFQEMFLDEAKIASRIEHANVAQILDLGEEDDILYLAMEYVDGDSLSKLNRACMRLGTKIPTGIILRVLADICAGLQEAHELKDATGAPLEIVHRDVSPHNVLVSTKGVAKLIDFGIATARSRAVGETSSGVLKGKIQYMAPEQALGQTVDRRADIWAVGAILYHLLVGKPPYEGDNQLATLHLLGSGRPPVPLASDVHPAVSGIVRKALSFSAANRYSTAAEMRAAFEHAMVEAQLVTTPTDVAAFAAQHVGDRAEKRRNAIEAALAAADERERAEESGGAPTLRAIPRTGAVTAMMPVPSSQPSVTPGDGATAAEGPGAKGSLDALAKMTPRLSDAPQTSSYATLGSAALGTSVHLPPKSRKGIFATAAVVVIAAAVATGFSLSTLRSKPSQAGPSAAGAPEGTPIPARSGVAAPPLAATESSSTIPTIAASSLPRAATASAEPASSAQRRPWPLAAPTKTPPKKTPGPSGSGDTTAPPPAGASSSPATPPPPQPAATIDDGF